jgi:hypothetical protein
MELCGYLKIEWTSLKLCVWENALWTTWWKSRFPVHVGLHIWPWG